MKLRFYSRDGHTVAWPGGKSPGQIPHLVGRSFKPSTKPGVAGVFVADKEAAEVDSDAPEAAHLIRQCQKGGLWPADEATAASCGVEFVKVAQDTDGEWIKAPSAPAAAPSPAATKKSESKGDA
jgi:hypothetical protein